MVEAATEFKKSGFSDDDAAQLGQLAALYQNIADEEVSAGESASFIIAQLVAFGDTMSGFTSDVEKASHVIDAVNEVSNRFAVSSSDLAGSLGIVSSSASAMGNSLEETLGIICH